MATTQSSEGTKGGREGGRDVGDPPTSESPDLPPGIEEIGRAWGHGTPLLTTDGGPWDRETPGEEDGGQQGQGQRL